jgi:hypothetical protein
VSGEAERKLLLTIEVNAYGTEAQAVATAERITSMLEVELHQKVKLSSFETKKRKAPKRRKKVAKHDALPDG